MIFEATPTDIVGLIQTGGVSALLIVILLGGVKKWWVFGWYYTESQKQQEALAEECEEWKSLALQSTNLAESLSELKKYK